MRKRIEEVNDGFFLHVGNVYGFRNNKPVVVFTIGEDGYTKPQFNSEPSQFMEGTFVDTVWVEVIPTKYCVDVGYSLLNDKLMYNGKEVGHVDTELLFLEEPPDKSEDNLTCDRVFIKVSSVAGKVPVTAKGYY